MHSLFTLSASKKNQTPRKLNKQKDFRLPCKLLENSTRHELSELFTHGDSSIRVKEIDAYLSDTRNNKQVRRDAIEEMEWLGAREHTHKR